MTTPGDNGGPFWDPFNDVFGAVSPSAFPSPPAVVFPNVVTSIQAPITTPSGGPQPPSLRWAVVANVTPYALGVAQDRYIKTLAPYTLDKVQLSDSTGTNAIAVLPVNPPNFVPTVNFGTIPTGISSGPEQVLVTWYETDPDPSGSYPCGCGPAFGQTAQTIGSFAFSVPSGGPGSLILSTPIQVEPWMRTLAVNMVQSGGTATGFRVNAALWQFRTTDVGQQTIVTRGQWAYLPVLGQPVQLTVQPLLNDINDGTFQGTIMVVGLADFYPVPVNGSYPSPLLVGGGFQASVTVGAAATTSVIPGPPVGFVVRVTSQAITNTAAPAAAGIVQLQGSISGAAYGRWAIGTAAPVNVQNPARFLVFDASAGARLNFAEGLSLFNNTSIGLVYTATWDVLPIPWGTDY